MVSTHTEHYDLERDTESKSISIMKNHKEISFEFNTQSWLYITLSYIFYNSNYKTDVWPPCPEINSSRALLWNDYFKNLSR